MDILRDLAEMGAKLARRAYLKTIDEDDARLNQPLSKSSGPAEATPPVAAPNRPSEFERLAISVRRTIHLARQVAQPLEAHRIRPQPSPDRPAGSPGPRAGRRNPDYENLNDRAERPNSPERHYPLERPQADRRDARIDRPDPAAPPIPPSGKLSVTPPRTPVAPIFPMAKPSQAPHHPAPLKTGPPRAH